MCIRDSIRSVCVLQKVRAWSHPPDHSSSNSSPLVLHPSSFLLNFVLLFPFVLFWYRPFLSQWSHKRFFNQFTWIFFYIRRHPHRHFGATSAVLFMGTEPRYAPFLLGLTRSQWLLLAAYSCCTRVGGLRYHSVVTMLAFVLCIHLDTIYFVC